MIKNLMILFILSVLFLNVTLSAKDSAGVLFFDELFGRPDIEIKREQFNKVVKPELWKKLAEFHKKQYGLKSLVQRSSEWESSIENISKMQKGKAPKGLDGKPMNIHHIKPLALNGTNEISNFKILSETEHVRDGNYCKNHPELCKLAKTRSVSKRTVFKTIKYIPYISVVGTIGAYVIVFYNHSWLDAFYKKEFFKDFLSLSISLASSIYFTESAFPVCIAAGTAFSPLSGAVCVFIFGATAYYFSGKITDFVFDLLLPEKISG